MGFDILIKNAVTRDSQGKYVQIAISGGKIVEISDGNSMVQQIRS